MISASTVFGHRHDRRGQSIVRARIPGPRGGAGRRTPGRLVGGGMFETQARFADDELLAMFQDSLADAHVRPVGALQIDELPATFAFGHRRTQLGVASGHLHVVPDDQIALAATDRELVAANADQLAVVSAIVKDRQQRRRWPLGRVKQRRSVVRRRGLCAARPKVSPGDISAVPAALLRRFQVAWLECPSITTLEDRRGVRRSVFLFHFGPRLAGGHDKLFVHLIRNTNRHTTAVSSGNSTAGVSTARPRAGNRPADKL